MTRVCGAGCAVWIVGPQRPFSFASTHWWGGGRQDGPALRLVASGPSSARARPGDGPSGPQGRSLVVSERC